MAPQPNLRMDPAHSQLAGTHLGRTTARVAALVSRKARVLNLGCEDPALLAELAARDCQVDRIAPGAVVTEGDNGDSTGLMGFDAIVAIDQLGRVRDPEALLPAIRERLASKGRFLLTVPNAAHEKVRDAVSAGHDPYRCLPSLDTQQLRLFSRKSVIDMLEEAGFAVGRVEGIIESALVMVESPESLVETWLVVAYKLPEDDLRWIQTLLRQSASEREKAERKADETARLHEEVLTMLDAAHRRSRKLVDQLASARGSFLESQEKMLRRDEEHRATTHELITARDAAEGKLRDGQAHLAKLREALEQWHQRSEEEFEQSKRDLVTQRDAAFQHALAAETRCRSLELRIEHVLMEWPRRVLRRIKRRVRGGP